MNWEAISAIAEVLGAIGIIISIVYLGTQIRQSNRVAEDNAFHAHLSLGQTAMRSMAEPGNREIVVKGFSNYEGLEASEKIVFDNVLFGIFSSMESVLQSNERNLIHDQEEQAIREFMRQRFLSYPGTLSWWSRTRDIFAPEMQDWVEKQIEKTPLDNDFYGANPSE